MIFPFVSKIYRWQDKNQEKEKLKLLYLTPLVPKPAARGAKLLLHGHQDGIIKRITIGD